MKKLTEKTVTAPSGVKFKIRALPVAKYGAASLRARSKDEAGTIAICVTDGVLAIEEYTELLGKELLGEKKAAELAGAPIVLTPVLSVMLGALLDRDHALWLMDEVITLSDLDNEEKKPLWQLSSTPDSEPRTSSAAPTAQVAESKA